MNAVKILLIILSNHCLADCLRDATLTFSPAPPYNSGDAVTFTFTVTHWEQPGNNWFHSVCIHFGNGWDTSTIIAIPPNTSCSGVRWNWYNRLITGWRVTDGPGFFVESWRGCPGVCNSNNPGDNYGDNDPWATCQWVFKWTIIAKCPGTDLSLEVITHSDSQTGSWDKRGCDNDPTFKFESTLTCCSPSACNDNNPCTVDTCDD